MKYSNIRFWIMVLLFLLFIALIGCSKPFLVGKTHQLVIGKPKANWEVVKMLKKDTDERGFISVVFIQGSDTLALDHLTEKEFKKLFHPIN